MLTPLDTILARDMVTVALLSPFVLACLKPFLSRLPVFAPDSPDRDVAMNVVLYLINLSLLCGVLSAESALDLRYWLAIVLAAGAQHSAGAIGYLAIKHSIPTVQAAKAKAKAQPNDTIAPAPDGTLYTSQFSLPVQLPPDLALDVENSTTSDAAGATLSVDAATAQAHAITQPAA